jgi:arylsulfatase A-like enzyme
MSPDLIFSYTPPLMKGILISTALTASFTCFSQATQHPNVILIITDDQGYGDLGCTGNPYVKTPNLDKFAGESVRFNNFYVSPVSAPTRSSLMTGRYSLRTGVHDTYNGGAIMASNELTVAEMLKGEKYTTGIFGKWHLGDNYPCRPEDQGFDESVIHLGGGMGQPGDFTTWFRKDSSYYDPILWHNGKKEAYKGYVSDIFATQAIRFVENNSKGPFFCYLSFNAPHDPLQVPAKYYNIYKDIDPSKGFEKDSRPFPRMTEEDKESARKVYAMVTNIDENVGRLLDKLKELNIEKNTVVIFMTDNGPMLYRYIAGMRGKKAWVYRGGIRVPFFIRYPALFDGNKDIGITAAHIDVLPTLSKICNAPLPTDRLIDGKNLLPLIRGEKVDWAGRSLFFYWSRRYPELYRNIALQKGNYKLVGQTDYNSEITGFELFEIEKDPYEQNNIVKGNIPLAMNLKSEMDKYVKELISSDNLTNPPRISIGTKYENPVFLSRNDADGPAENWTREETYGKWRVSISEGIYNIRFRFITPLKPNGTLSIETGTIVNQMVNKTEGATELEMKNVSFRTIDCDFIPHYSVDSRNIFPFWVELERIK